jgi:hypothetical protein
MFSIVTVASSTRMPTASARPPRVMMLIVCPSALRIAIELRIESGIETAMISVLRQLPRKIRIISAVRHAAMIASRTTPLIAPRTKIDWSASGVSFSCGGTSVETRGSILRMSFTTSSVEALPALSTLMSTPRWPSCRAMLVCTWNPSLTVETSRR